MGDSGCCGGELVPTASLASQMQFKKLDAALEDYKQRGGMLSTGRAVIQYEKRIDQGDSYYEFYHVDMEAYLDEYLSPTHGWKQRLTHEAILKDAPIKVFVDVEYEEKGGYKLDGTEAAKMRAIQVQVEDAMRSDLGISPVPTPITVDATTPTKFSRHLVYPIWMTNPQHLRALVKHIPGLDLAPYCSAKNRTCKFLRMPYSEKIGKGNPLLPLGEPLPNKGESIDPELMCAGLLTWIITDPTSKYYDFLRPPDVIYSMSAQKMGTAGTMFGGMGGVGLSLQAGKEVEGRAHRILEHLRMTRAQFAESNMEIKKSGAWECTIVPPFPCPTKVGGKHSSHSMFVGSYDSRKVYIRCPGNACRVTIYLPEDFTSIAFGGVDFAGPPDPPEEATEEAEEAEVSRPALALGCNTNAPWFDESVLWPRGPWLIV